MPSAAGPPLVVSAAGALMSIPPLVVGGVNSGHGVPPLVVGAAPAAEGPRAVSAVNTPVPVPSHRWGLQAVQAVRAVQGVQGVQGVQASPNQGLEYVFPLEREAAGGGGGAAPPAQARPPQPYPYA